MASFKNEEFYSLSALMKNIRNCVTTSLTVEIADGEKKALLMGDFESVDKDVTFLVNTGSTKMSVEWSYTDGYAGSAAIYYPGTGNIVKVDLSEGAGQITIPAYEGVLVVREDENDLTHGIVSEETSQGSPEETTEGGLEETSQQTESDKKSGCRSALGGSATVAIGTVACGTVFFVNRKKRSAVR
jgi:hypothetical protein